MVAKCAIPARIIHQTIRCVLISFLRKQAASRPRAGREQAESSGSLRETDVVSRHTTLQQEAAAWRWRREHAWVPTRFWLRSGPGAWERSTALAIPASGGTWPHVLALYDVGTHDGVPYAVTELLEGCTLRTVLERRPLPSRKAVAYGVQICRGLAAAHERGVARWSEHDM